MTRKTVKTGKGLERRVADAYRAMGARRVQHDVELAGNQIDVYVELEAPGHLLHRIAVEAKDWSRPVGIDVVNDFAQIANLLRGGGLIDEGVIVSAKGFSKQARNAAQTYGILLLEPTDLDSMVAEAMAATGQVKPAFLAEAQDMVLPGRSKRRRIVAIVVILAVVVSLFLTTLTQLCPASSEPPDTALPPPDTALPPPDTALPIGSLLWILHALVSFIAILASVLQLTGFDLRELFSTRPAGAGVEAFPFHIIRDFDELLDYLFPDPTAPLLPDRSIRFFPRIADELDAAFSRHGRVLVRGRSKTGKTREVVELLRRWWYTGPTVLLAKNHVGLFPPYKVPTTLPVRNLVLLFDDVDRYCDDADATKRLDQTIDFFADLCHDPEELRVVATARQEPEFWDELRYDESDPPWDEFDLLSLPALPPDGARRLIDHLAQDCDIAVDPAVTEELATKNDGTFLNLVLSFRSWLHEGVKHVGQEQAAAFEGILLATWRRRYERLVKLLPEAGPIYAAVDLLQTLDVPLRRPLIAELATEMNVSRACHLLGGLYHWIIWHKLHLSPRLDWYRDPRRRRRGIALAAFVALPMLYALFYLLFCIMPASFQVNFLDATRDQFWPYLLIISPSLITLLLLVLSGLHRHFRHRRVQAALDRLLETEVPLRGDELRPYEGQFEDNGASLAWSPAFFSGKGEATTFSRPVTSRLAALYCTWAERLRAAGELAPARSLAWIARILAPDHPTPPLMLGTLWYDEGDFARALAEFDRSRALNPSATAALALERIAWCRYQLHQFEQAETAAGQALALTPSLPAARWARGLARLQQSHTEPGLADCRRAALAKKVPPPDLADGIVSALTAARSQDWADEVRGFLERDRPARGNRPALSRTFRVYEVEEHIGLLLILMGCLYFATRVAFSLPLQLVDFLLTLYPRAPILLLERGHAYDRMGEYELAIVDYTEAISLQPDLAWVYEERGLAYGIVGEYELAIADFTEAIRFDPEDFWTYNNRCWVYNGARKHQQAAADCTEAMRLEPEIVNPYTGRCCAYRQMRQYELALADCTEAIRLDPEYVHSYIERGRVYHEMGQCEQAIVDFTEAIRVDPDFASAYGLRSYPYHQMGEYELALADCTEAIRLDPDLAWVYHRRGDIYRQIGQHELAIADWQRALQLFEAQGQTEEAEQTRRLLSWLED